MNNDAVLKDIATFIKFVCKKADQCFKCHLELCDEYFKEKEPCDMSLEEIVQKFKDRM